MNEKVVDFSNYSVCVRIGYNIQYIDMEFLAAVCDRFLFEELSNLVAQSPVSTVIYSGYRNKTKFIITINPKEV